MRHEFDFLNDIRSAADLIEDWVKDVSEVEFFDSEPLRSRSVSVDDHRRSLVTIVGGFEKQI